MAGSVSGVAAESDRLQKRMTKTAAAKNFVNERPMRRIMC
jgi:hypothetical protein